MIHNYKRHDRWIASNRFSTCFRAIPMNTRRNRKTNFDWVNFTRVTFRGFH